MSIVTSSYNFVPLNENVCFPEWADAVSQDVPLQGAVSGVIELNITAKTPIFVRGECTATQESGHQEFSFMRHNNRYCIPGSSIKGTIANVLEILSFGKLQKVNDHRFSQRDWENSGIYDKQSFARENKGGWLYYDEDEDDKCYKIDYSTNSIGRIEHKVIDTHFKTKFQEIFGEEFDPSVTGENKSALKKYKLLHDKKLKLENAFVKIPKRERFEQQKYKIHPNEKDAQSGTLVFSGQPAKREYKDGEWQGKNKEFIFWEPDAIGVKVDDRLIEDFLFAYYDHDPKQMTTDWKHWREVLANGGRVPIFLQLDDNNNIMHFGLSMLYKLPYRNRIKDLIPKGHLLEGNDFVETLFGYSIDKESNKGRVSFKHAFAVENAQELTPKTLVLGGPKASFYPFYLKQKFQHSKTTQINGTYQTYDNGATLAGRKRYPIKHVGDEETIKTAFSTTFTPLKAGTVFTTEIVYHNLLPVELGALVCALTFNEVEACHHGIGMAKPYGYGAVAVALEMDENVRRNSILAFRAYMESWWIHNTLSGTWSKSEQLKELIAMARFSKHRKKLAYLELEEFPKVKKAKEALPRFTHFLGTEPLVYPTAYMENINQFVESEKKRLAKAKRIVDENNATIEAKKKQDEIDGILAKGLTSWISEVTSYGVLKEKMNAWLAMRNDQIITDETALESLKSIIIQIRNKKAPRHRKTFFNENKRNDLIKWIGSEAAEKLIAYFNQ
ncbi:TIGR03986 family CRISPR-associated RAMP protein [Kordia sp. YSTF-M3]|uniref:TIGR03986 family CRISPR-associated RAMP protein n=1 Tax=Kordia aestuariivivens TaxID=2759037 RepID=A0ABR7Q5U2_9FLAO|nr:TIGR03986 family CRISPR-associated RAMP protein [Kordia aestuariivivens]MBC8753940.1 TIGR03986 family CRISPR-associated RAMP protein [Kordia aestuariivivens]